MKVGGLFLLLLGCGLAVLGAYLLGRVHGAEARVRIAGSTDVAAADERFWRFEAEVVSGSRETVPATLARPNPLRRPARAESLTGPDLEEAMGRILEREERSQGELKLALARERDRTTGPLLEGWYANDQLHFRGHQLHDADRGWMREGQWEAYHENGTPHELGAYREEEEHGPWRWWYESGVLMAEGHFVNGRREGPWTFYYENGRRMMEGEYAGGDGVGGWIYYYENGFRRAEGAFEDGSPTGEWTVWRPDGGIDAERTGLYRDGELVGG